MSKDKLEVIEVDINVNKTYNVTDQLSFKLTLDCKSLIEDDVEFEVIYFGDAVTDQNDQRIGYNAIGPLQPGKQYFELETSPIDLTKVPIKTLFGLTTILIVGKYHGQQFIRIGYVVNVKYPGVDSDKLLDSDDVPLNEGDGLEGDEEEEIEVMEDEELDDEEGDDEEEGENEEGSEEEGDDEEDDSGLVDDVNSGEYDEEAHGDEFGEGCHHKEELGENLIFSILGSKNNQVPIPCETPIVEGIDEFEYKDIKMKQSCIELELIQKPIIHVYEIDWLKGGKAENDELVESSEENSSGSNIKKAKCN